MLLASFALLACGGGGSDTAPDAVAAETVVAADGDIAVDDGWRIRKKFRTTTTTEPTPTTSTTPTTTEPTTSPTAPTTTEPSASTSPTTTSPTTSTQPSPYTTYATYADGVKRSFAFDGSAPFVNAETKRTDLLGWLYNGVEVDKYGITNTGAAPWISKVSDNGAQATRFQVFPGDAEMYGWRSQVSSHQFENFKHYRYELEFKLDANWNFSMPNGEGLLWQAKGTPKAGQYGHASMSLGVTGNNLYFSVLYPNSAMNASTWPTSLTWPNNDYVATSFPTRKLEAGRYYKVRMEFFADDRPPQFGGQGYMNVWLDDVLWIQHKGPNLHPDQKAPHRWDFGWYAWGGKPSTTRTVYFKTSHAYVR